MSMAAASRLTVGDESYEIFRIDALQDSHDVARLPYTLRILLENVLRNAGDEEVEAVAGWVAQAEPSREISFTPARVLLPGLHRRPGRRRPRRDAKRDARLRRRPGADQPAAPVRARDRPLGAGRRVRLAVRLRAQRRARARAQPRALRLPALGPDRLRQLQGRPAGHGHRPPDQPRVPRPRRRGARRARVPRHARRHRLAHDDGERARRARLGRRRDRGRGGDARRVALDARPAGRRLPALGRAARGLDRDRPRAHGGRDPAQDRRRREVRRVLRPRRLAALAGRPRDDREHVPGVRRDLRLLPGRRRDARATCG